MFVQWILLRLIQNSHKFEGPLTKNRLELSQKIFNDFPRHPISPVQKQYLQYSSRVSSRLSVFQRLLIHLSSIRPAMLTCISELYYITLHHATLPLAIGSNVCELSVKATQKILPFYWFHKHCSHFLRSLIP